jgi:hypothetical protein
VDRRRRGRARRSRSGGGGPRRRRLDRGGGRRRGHRLKVRPVAIHAGAERACLPVGHDRVIGADASVLSPGPDGLDDRCLPADAGRGTRAVARVLSTERGAGGVRGEDRRQRDRP